MQVTSSQAARRLGLAAAVSIVACPAAARADAVDQPTAEVLFADGRRLLVQGKYAEACPKFAESQRLDPAIGTLLNLADCYEKLGRTASAWAAFREAAASAHHGGDTKREAVAKERAAALEGKLSTLAIAVPRASEVEGLVVKRDGVALGRAVWGSAVPVDPGQHTVTAWAPGKRQWSTSVGVDAAHAAVAISVPALVDAPEVVLPPDGPGGAGARGRKLGGQRIAALAVGSLGVASVAVGGLLGFLADARNDASAPHCHGNICDQEGVDLRHRALGLANASTGAFIGGLAAMGLGLTLWLTAPSGPPKAGLRAAPWVGLGSAGAHVEGAF